MTNKQYFLRLWIPILVAVAIILFFVVSGILNGNYDTLVSMVVVLGFAGIFFFFIWRRTNGKLASLLQQPSTQPFYDWYDSMMWMTPNKAVSLALSKGIISAYYGEFEKTRQAYESVQWDGQLPYFAAQGPLLQVLLDYLENNNYEMGYRHALRAQELGAIDLSIPGKDTTDRAFRVYVDAGDVMRGNSLPETIQALEQAKQQLPMLGKLLAAWALEHAYRSKGDTAQADEMHTFLVTNAPYCNPLLKQ